MSRALRLLLSLAGCTLLGGALLPPRDVKLEAQNFHVRLRWEPDPGAAFQATFQVEWRRRTSQWIDAGACWGNSTGPSWVCELYFDKIHDIYWARVRAVAGGEHSEWAYSRELQLYRDTIVGPPRLSWLLQGDILTVNIIMPLTPYRRKAGSQKPVDRVLLKLWYWLRLYEGDMLVQQVPCRRSREEAPCTFRDLKPSTQYCLRTVAADMSRERSREAEQCMITATGTAGFPWVLLVVLSGIFLLLTVSGLCFLLRLLFPSPLETHLPKTLVSEECSSLCPPCAVAESGSPALPGGSAPPSLHLLHHQNRCPTLCFPVLPGFCAGIACVPRQVRSLPRPLAAGA
ncbi:interleukin-22 receptor subunit alpha-2-like isoform X1 [Pezoporus wallicus]|uniref:interleukin-22 receptor subunit alpha-2-like isoform X1 n=1 Tax=Pezoporus wallicus TaxID=35540 RepID=UPI00254D2DF3|nr:interleukin-22 receptor subunit alpha-2-like isoform X1 [Pezoporus wallicus]